MLFFAIFKRNVLVLFVSFRTIPLRVVQMSLIRRPSTNKISENPRKHPHVKGVRKVINAHANLIKSWIHYPPVAIAVANGLGFMGQHACGHIFPNNVPYRVAKQSPSTICSDHLFSISMELKTKHSSRTRTGSPTRPVASNQA